MVFSNGINAPKENYGKGRKMISVMDILDTRPIEYNNIRNSVQVDEKNEIKNMVEKGDIVFVRSSEVPEEVGWAKAYLIDEYALYSGFSIRGKKRNSFNAHFVELALNFANRKQLERKSGGSTRFNISQAILNSIDILMPKIDEQNELDLLFTQLDKIITLHQRKLDLLKQLKQACLKKLFPVNGETVPELRFTDFEEEWEQRKLEDCAEILTGGTPKTSISEYWEPKKIPWMSSGEVNKRRIDETDNMISEEGLNNSSARWVKKHSVLIALAGQGKTRGTVAVNNIQLTTNQSIAAIVPNDNFHYEFIYQNLIKRYDELRMISSGDGTRGGLNKQIVSDVVIPSPSKDEQIKIGTFFQQLDDTMTLHQSKLDQLKQLKAAFLQKMFI